MATFSNITPNTLIAGTNEADSVENYGSNVTITVGEGDDSIYNYGDSVTITSGTGKDSIENFGRAVTISSDNGDDTITNRAEASNSSINGGAGNDSINNWAGEIWNEEKNKYDIIPSPDNTTLIGGAGDDTIYNEGSKVLIDGGTDKDLLINGGYWESERGGKNVSINGGSGNDTITSHGSKSVLDGGANDDIIYNGYRYYAPWNAFYDSDDKNYNGDKTTILGGTGNDTIKNRGEQVLISAGTGDDSVDNYGSDVTINVGMDNNYIYSSGENVLVLIEGGKNIVEGNVTVNMGKSNVTLTGDRSEQIYQYVGGNDVITNYSHEDIVHITSGNLDSYSFDGGDLIFHIGSGSLRLKNMTNHAITVKDSSGKTTTQIYSNGYSPQQVIKNFVQSMAHTVLDTRLKIDEAIKSCSGFNSLQDVINKMVADCRAAGEADAFLRDYCGIILDNDDTGAILGWEAGGLSAKTMSDLMPEIGEGVYPESTTFVKHGVTITVPEKDTLTEKEQLVVRGFYSWWAEAAFKLLEETYGLSLKGYSMKLTFFDDSTAFAWGLGGSGGVQVNMAYTQGITETSNAGLDGLFSHELTHFLQGTLNVWSYMTNYMSEGMADATAGRPKSLMELAADYIKLAAYLDVDNTFSSDRNVYAAGYMFWRYLMKQASDAYDSSQNYAWKDNSAISGTSAAELLTGNAKNQTIMAGAGNDTITDYGKGMKIFGEDGDDSILAKGDEHSISGGAGNDSIRNYSGQSVKISTDAGNDYIYNDGSNVTITAGEGDDSIYNYGDSVTITSGTGKDSIENFGRAVTISGDNGDDTIINRAEASNSSINGGAGNDSINNWAGEIWNEEKNKYDITPSPDNTTLIGGAGDDTIYNEGSKVLIDGGTDKDLLINGGYWESERGGKNVSINGGSGNDTITSHGSKSVLDGGANDDIIYNGYRYYAPWNAFYDSDDKNYNGDKTTILGGKGNDTIKNLGNNVVFHYTLNDGNDLIEGFNKTSKLSISGGAYALIKSDDAVIVNVGKSNVTLEGAASLSKVNIKGTKSATLTATNLMPSLVAVDSSIKMIDASSRTKAIQITGNKLANTINGGSGSDSINGGSNNDTLIGGKGGKDTLIGGNGHDSLSGGTNHDKLYGGKGDDTLIGGTGKDSLWGDAGADTFIYNFGDGQDTIFGFDSKDTLTLDGLNFTSSYKKGVVSLKFEDGGSVSFKDFTTKTSFHIDDSVYKISGSKLKMR